MVLCKYKSSKILVLLWIEGYVLLDNVKKKMGMLYSAIYCQKSDVIIGIILYADIQYNYQTHYNDS